MKDGKILGWIWKNAKGQKLNIFFLMLFNVSFAITSVVFALAVKMVVDNAVSQNQNGLILGCVFIVAVILLQFLFRLLSRLMQEKVKGKLAISLRTLTFRNILNKKHSAISKFHSGELLNVVTSDVDVVCEGVTEIAPEVFACVARLLTAVITLVLIDWVFAIAFLVAGVMIFLVSFFMKKNIKKYHRKVQETDGVTKAYMQENIENSLAVKVFSTQDKVLNKTQKLQDENFNLKMKRRSFSAFGHASFNLIASLGYVFALIYGGVLIFLQTGFSYGDLSAVLQLVNSVQIPFMNLSNIIPKYFTMLASAERIIAIENIENEEQILDFDQNECYKNLQSIQFNDLSFSYDKDLILKNCNFEIQKGQTVAIIGGSGNGKTTLLKLLLGVYQVDGGEIALTFNNKRENISAKHRKLFCYVPQGNYIFSGTIRENLTFISDDATEEEIINTLEICNLKEFINSLPNGLDTVIGEKGSGLSEGQLQRLAIARGLLSNAPILLLDEVTSALDQKTEAEILENIKKLKDKTVIIITHKPKALEMCDKKFMVDEKSVIEV